MWFFDVAALFRFYHFALCLHHVFLSEQIKMMMMMIVIIKNVKIRVTLS